MWVPKWLESVVLQLSSRVSIVLSIVSALFWDTGWWFLGAQLPLTPYLEFWSWNDLDQLLSFNCAQSCNHFRPYSLTSWNLGISYRYIHLRWTTGVRAVTRWCLRNSDSQVTIFEAHCSYPLMIGARKITWLNRTSFVPKCSTTLMFCTPILIDL